MGDVVDQVRVKDFGALIYLNSLQRDHGFGSEAHDAAIFKGLVNLYKAAVIGVFDINLRPHGPYQTCSCQT